MKFLIPLLTFLVCISQSSAAILVRYQFGTNLNPTSTDLLATASALGGTGTLRSNGGYALQSPQAVNSGYMQFTLTADSGYFLDLSDVAFQYDFLQTGGTASTVTGTFAVQYSLDGFATAGITLTSPQASYSSASNGVEASPTFGSDAVFNLTGIANTSSISFRIMLSNDGSLDTNQYRYAIDNLTVNGAMVAVPEPASISLLIFGLTGIVLSRRGRLAA